MASALEGGGQPEFDHPVDESFPQQVGREAQDIRIVVSTAHLGRQVIVTRRRTDAGELIGGDTHSQSRSAYQVSPVYLAAADFSGN